MIHDASDFWLIRFVHDEFVKLNFDFEFLV